MAGGKTQWGFALRVHCVFVTEEKQRSDTELEVPLRCLALLMREAVEAHRPMDCSPVPGGEAAGKACLMVGGGDVPQARRRLLARLQIGASDPLIQLQSGLVLPSSCSCTRSMEEAALSPHWLVAAMVSTDSPGEPCRASMRSLRLWRQNSGSWKETRISDRCRHHFIFSTFAVISSDK